MAIVLFAFLLSFYWLIGKLVKQNNRLNQLTDQLESLLQNEAEQKKRILEIYDTKAAEEKKTLDSIRYARTIQLAMLPHKSVFEKAFQEHFILFLPRDFVSGDFYWFRKVISSNGQEMIFVSLADCTGHGVPGALMSMMGYSYLDEIVGVRQILEPKDILSKLDKMFRLALHQEEKMNTDGMDLGICRFVEGEEGAILGSYAGAGNSIYFTSERSANLQRIRGKSTPIGGYRSKNSHYEQHTMHLSRGDVLYMLSDGLSSQKGKDGNRIGTPKVISTISEHLKEPMEGQKIELEKAIRSEMFGREQMDDITVIGLRM